MKLKHLLTAALLLATVGVSFAQSPKRELRSTWLTTVWAIDWPESTNEAKAKAQMIECLDNLYRHNYTGVCFQVRGLADAMYKSSYEPWSSSISGTRGEDPGWDPLAWVVEECHKRGMECYAWVNPYRICSNGNGYSTEYDLEWKEKGWYLSNGNYIVFNPGLAECRAHILNVIKEIYTNYAIDGMLFDDYFYPSGGTSESSSAPDYALYKKSGTTLSIGDWRRENVNNFMKEIYTNLQNDRPDVRFGLAPAGVATKSAHKYGFSGPEISASDWQYNSIYSDPLAWVAGGYIDFISPQLYWKTTSSSAPFGPLTTWWSAFAEKYNRHFYASHSISFLAEGENNEAGWSDVASQVSLHRHGCSNNAPGAIYYSTKNIDGNGGGVAGLGDYLEEKVYTGKSLVPVITWKEHPTYAAPAGASFSGSTLSWNETKGEGKAIIRYSLYAVPMSVSLEEAMSVDGDGLAGQYLMGVSYSTEFEVPAAKREGFWYAVCVYDGYGYESEAATVNYTGERSAATTLTAPINGAVTNWDTEFSWTEVPGASYNVEIALDEKFSLIAVEAKGLTTNKATFDLGDIKDNTLCYWRVTVAEPNKIYTISDIETFYSPTRVKPAAAELLTPADGAEVSDREITFSWSAVERAEAYRFEIAIDGNFYDIMFGASLKDGSTSITLNSAMFGSSEYGWRVSAHGRCILSNLSAVSKFTVAQAPVGSYEEGYTMKTDKDSYADASGLQLENIWLRSTAADYENITFEESGSFNRGMVANKDYVYVSGRSANTKDADIYLYQYNASTGELVRKLNLSEEGVVPNLPCNDVIKDSYGNICIVNQVAKATSDDIYIHKVDFANGELTQVACLSNNKRTVVQLDHVGIYGSVDDSEFTVYAAVASRTSLARWNVVDGEAACEAVAISDYYPSGVKNFGQAPRVVPVDENLVYVDGGSTGLTLYDFSTKEIVSSFADKAELMSTSYADNGACYFTLDGRNYMVYNLYPAAENVRWALTEFAEEHDLSTGSALWTLPAGGLGSIDSGTYSAPIDVVVTSDKTANIYVYSPGNGLAAYRLTDVRDAGVADVEAGDFSISTRGLSVVFSQSVAVAKAYSLSGVLVASAENAESLVLPAAGVYAVVADGKSQIVQVK